MLWPIGVDGAKRQIYHRLKTTEPGPGCMHFPIGLPEEYYEQLTAEKASHAYKHGVPYGEWIRVRPRNEAIDCEVYAYAAAIRAGMGRLDWGRLEQALALRAAVSADLRPPWSRPRHGAAAWAQGEEPGDFMSARPTQGHQDRSHRNSPDHR